MIPGSKGQKSDASLLAGEFLNLGPAKNMSKKPFLEEKMSGLRMFLELRECKARSNSISELFLDCINSIDRKVRTYQFFIWHPFFQFS